MIIDKFTNKISLKKVLNYLPFSYLEELASLLDVQAYDKDEIIDVIERKLKNKNNLNNYYQTLNELEKKVLADIVHNLNGRYVQGYILAKYNRLPSFERKSILFANSSKPGYFSLFVYNEALIPYDLLILLKDIVPKPKNFGEKPLYNDKENTYFYIYLYALAGIVSLNENFSIPDSSKNLFSQDEAEKVSGLLKLMIFSGITEKNKKRVSVKKNVTPDKLLFFLFRKLISDKKFLSEIYPQKSEDFLENIIKYRNFISKKLMKLGNGDFWEINEIYDFFEKEYQSEIKKIALLKNEKIKDMENLFLYLSYLELLKLWPGLIPVVYADKDEISDFFNSKNTVSLNREVILLQNLEIVFVNNVSEKNINVLNLFCDKKGSNRFLINKKKLLKLLNKGFSLEWFKFYMENISLKDLPENFVMYLRDLEENKVIVDTFKNEISGNKLFILSLLHDKNISLYVEKIQDNKLRYDDKVKDKIINYITKSGYYFQKV